MLTVSDILTSDIVSLRSSVTVARAIRLMQQQQMCSLVVDPEVEGGDYGLLSVNDIVAHVTAKAADPNQIVVCEIMQKPCLVVNADLSLVELAQRFAQTGQQQAVVLHRGQLAGWVTTADVVLKSLIDPVVLPPDFSEQLRLTLQRKRLSWSTPGQIERDCAIAWETVKELQPISAAAASQSHSSQSLPSIPEADYAPSSTRPLCHPWVNS